ncbi:MAG: RIP metalloprotease RseP [Lachnospiraceae bacterium]|nr:RIP metalloprotease RseP [Lachnospiraceae bacterium]
MHWILAIIILGLLIFFHELGHFILAKLNGVTVEEFSIGFGPRLVSFVSHGTRYSLKVLPFGGSCMMTGMYGDDEEEDEDQEPSDETASFISDDEEPYRPSYARGSFLRATPGQRAAIVAAGPVFSFLLAFIAAIIIMSGVGYDPPDVIYVSEGSEAEAAGLRPGDRVTSFNGHDIVIGRDVSAEFIFNEPVPGEEIRLTVKRDGQKEEIRFTPEKKEAYRMGISYVPGEEAAVISAVTMGSPIAKAGVEAGDVIVGINGQDIATAAELGAYFEEHPMDGGDMTIRYLRNGREKSVTVKPVVTPYINIGFSVNLGREKIGSLDVIKYSFYEVGYWIRTTFQSLGMFFKGILTVNDLSGPVGIANVVGDAYEEAKDEGVFMTLMNLLNLVILLSANLGVMNLLPIPAVDGGRLLFIIIEALRGKPLRRGVENVIQFIAAVFLILLMFYVLYHDIMKMF